MTSDLVPTDDLPDYLLASFVDLRHKTGRYPSIALVTMTAAVLTSFRAGVWVRRRGGLWEWDGPMLRPDHLPRRKN